MLSCLRQTGSRTHLGDDDHLTAAANRSEDTKGTEERAPPDVGYQCQYATDWTEVKPGGS